KVHAEVLSYVLTCAQNLQFKVCGLDFSPIKGPEGNIEYLTFLSKNLDAVEINFDEKINAVIDAAHKSL
ncbi:MAG: TlyA family rRNA (cytidine-2'-O)-methyltransferase, partial [Selenomonadaceae bacterium]|nr:TlyA family rRNA (cytidine-2'-O)-methyltransferase [Selenomonadaceae bacterium]